MGQSESSFCNYKPSNLKRDSPKDKKPKYRLEFKNQLRKEALIFLHYKLRPLSIFINNDDSILAPNIMLNDDQTWQVGPSMPIRSSMIEQSARPNYESVPRSSIQERRKASCQEDP